MLCYRRGRRHKNCTFSIFFMLFFSRLSRGDRLQACVYGLRLGSETWNNHHVPSSKRTISFSRNYPVPLYAASDKGQFLFIHFSTAGKRPRRRRRKRRRRRRKKKRKPTEIHLHIQHPALVSGTNGQVGEESSPSKFGIKKFALLKQTISFSHLAGTCRVLLGGRRR